MSVNLSQVIEQVGKDKGIDKDIIISAMETAMLTAAKKKFGNVKDIEAQFNPDVGEIELFVFKTVVEEVHNTNLEISPEEAVKHDPEAQLGDSLGFKVDTSEFGRVAATTAKQIIFQKVREAERDNIYNEYKDRKDELVSGIVRRTERKDYIVDLGRTEAILPEREQIKRERYRVGDRIQAYVIDVLKVSRGPQIILSRVCTNFLAKLFENEVPEIQEGIVKVVGAAREPGRRSKIAVYSEDVDVDPVGACVGMKGSRVQNIVQELRGEKIDIVPFSHDAAKFICNAISPAEVQKVILDNDERSIQLIVADDQLSLAIGKRGQNVRLASQLTRWKIDIQSESKIKIKSDEVKRMLGKTDLLDGATISLVIKHGYLSVQDILEEDDVTLSEMLGVSADSIRKVKESLEVQVKEAALAKEAELAEAAAAAARGETPADSEADDDEEVDDDTSNGDTNENNG